MIFSSAPSITALRVRGLTWPHSAADCLIACERSSCWPAAPGALEVSAGLEPRLGLDWPVLPLPSTSATSRPAAFAFAICSPWPGLGWLLELLDCLRD